MAIGDRTFDDGYNRMSVPTTLIPGAPTWYWGYNSKAGQYDAVNQQMVFHRGSSGQDSGSYGQYRERSGSSLSVSPEGGDMSLRDSLDAAGAKVDVSAVLYRTSRFGLRCDLGLIGAWMRDIHLSEERQMATVMESQYRDREDLTPGYDWTVDRSFTEEYRYNDVYNIVPLMPEAYASDYQGQPGFFMIGNRPTTRDVSENDRVTTVPHPSQTGRDDTRTRIWGAETKVECDLDIDRYTIRLGPTLEWFPIEDLALFASPALTLNWVDMNAVRKENLTIIDPNGNRIQTRSWRDTADHSEWVSGASIAAGAEYTAGNRWSVNLSLAREWMFGNPAVTVGPTVLKAHLDSYNVEGAVGCRF